MYGPKPTKPFTILIHGGEIPVEWGDNEMQKLRAIMERRGKLFSRRGPIDILDTLIGDSFASR